MPPLGEVEETALVLRKAEAVVESAKEKLEVPKLDLIKTLKNHNRKKVTVVYDGHKCTYTLEELEKLKRQVN